MGLFATTYGHLKKTRAFLGQADIIYIPPFDPFKEYGVFTQAGIFFRVLASARKHDTLLLYSSRGSLKPELLAIALLGLLPTRRRPAIALNGPMWEPDAGLHGFLERILVRMVDLAVTLYGVQSSGELTIFPQVWGIDPSKVRFIPYLFSFSENEIQEVKDQSGGYVFSGGNSHRDYEPLISAARALPDLKFIFATRLLDHRVDLPPNVTARQVSHREFVRLMVSAAIVVIPMKMNLRRSTGHQTYLNSLLLKKPTIVNDVLGVRDHLIDRETAYIVDGSAQDYVSSIQWILDPANQARVRQICDNGAVDVLERFSNETHAAKLRELALEARKIHRASISEN